MALDRIRIQNKLVEVALAGTYRPVTYNADTQMASADEGSSVTPAGAIANETRSTWSASAARNRREYVHDRASWRFVMFILFDQEVTLEEFERSLVNQPIRLLRDDALGVRQVTLHLIESEYDHAAQQESATGTKVRYYFEADLSPE